MIHIHGIFQEYTLSCIAYAGYNLGINKIVIVYPFHNCGISFHIGKKDAKLTGDHMKLLMLTLPFIVRDLIAREVNAIYPSFTRVMPGITCSYYGRSRSSMQPLIGQGL